MHPDLEAIRALDAEDEQVRNLAAALAKAQALEPDANAKVAAAKAALAAAQAALDAVRAAERASKRDTEQYEQRRTGAIRALEMGQGDPAAAERQLAQVTVILDDLETRQLELMEEAELKVATLAKAKQVLADAETALAAAQSAAPGQVRALAEQHHVALARRTAVAQTLRAEILNHYELVYLRKGRALSKLDRSGACPRCNTYPAAAMVAEARRGVTLLVCGGCHRWLDVTVG